MSKNIKKNGLFQGYEPNRISFYIILLETHRYDELKKVLFKDMEKYKIDTKNTEDK